MYYIGTSIIFNTEIAPLSSQRPIGNDGEVYEMFRVESGCALFLSDHLERFAGSIAAAHQSVPQSFAKLPSLVDWLIVCNSMPDGGVRLCLSANGLLQGGFVPTEIPTARMYAEGVHCELLSAMREQPNAKIYHAEMRTAAATQQAEHQAFESLLVDSDGNITEGSRSNVLFIKNNELYSAPDSRILGGIMRKKLFEICSELGISVHCVDIPAESIGDYEAAFISSTPARILPIASIADKHYSVENSLMLRLMHEMDIRVKQQIEKKH